MFLSLALSAFPLVFGANPITTPIEIEPNVDVHVRKFSQIPDYNGRYSRIVSISEFSGDLYVTTEISGGLIYKIDQWGTASLFFDVANAMVQSVNRTMDTTSFIHGGLRSVAFHPDYATNGKFYTSIMETRPPNGTNVTYLSDDPNPVGADSVLIEWTSNNGVPNPLSYRQVFRVGMPVYEHPIKQIKFYGNNLYVTHGDGSVQSSVVGGGQANDALGKILRINPLQSGSQPYTIPSDNPFVGNPAFLDEIYALGFNNPHHLCFSKSGELIVADAGRDNVEEINVITNGGNYGWPEREGTFVHLDVGGLLTGVAPLWANESYYNFTYPVAQVGHEGQLGDGYVGQAIAGGCPVENDSPLDGRYFYSDFPLTGKLYYSYMSDIRKAVVRGSPSELSQAPTYQAKIFFDHDNDTSTPAIEYANLGDIVKAEINNANSRADVRFGRGPNGELYWSSKRSGAVYLITNSVYTTVSSTTSSGQLIYDALNCGSSLASTIVADLRRALANAAKVSETKVELVSSCGSIVLDYKIDMDSSLIDSFEINLKEQAAATLGSAAISTYGTPTVTVNSRTSDTSSSGFPAWQVALIVLVTVFVTCMGAYAIYWFCARNKAEKIPAHELSVMNGAARSDVEQASVIEGQAVDTAN
uniref:Glucose/Sorbosone dehydrogenase domain-containing protein n=1 Tax=Lotharella globosa TaxID=91324 RepID=A0A7S3YDA8_9EUKA|mmetsp:Transcript_20940/g.42198  ORF Transcript_20940/g.42198 Transcript_20940/m.42198 type:complete len:643 (+) Transcript_20940:65-1993(+)|eukprot:CAMPEP_0167782062 /NCGR_PEP_ID=MMETSP0111_2-20121227/6301_1 /TAXON_ID=91324 /ORGANISM="Lotharella globosa, Strain CCCM811" /LENGTH=642 /DNA_ID=CAMNT_0007672837 /DNA_START=48 /DNA_END=1976 /DNA_ORIENTATION=+